ncbi:hypothetical protein ABK040_005474 [Willaertia magna]
MLSHSQTSTTNNLTNSFNKENIEKQIEEWKNKLNKFACPINQQIMINPVIIETGHTFERKSIEEWLKLNNTCPLSRNVLKFKTLTPNFSLKSTINEKIEKFITKVITNVKLWLIDNNLLNICNKLIDDLSDLINNSTNFDNHLIELNNLKFDILLKQNYEENLLFEKYLILIDELLPNLDYKILQLQKLEIKINNENNLQKYYIKLFNLIFESKNKNNNLLKETFIKYCKLNKLNYDLINDIFCYLDENIKLDYLIILFNTSNYNRNIILQKLITFNTKISNEESILFFKKLFTEINLTNINLKNLLNFIKDHNELKTETIIIYKELYNNTKKIKYLELIYELDNSNKDLELELLSEYLKLNLTDKYLNLYIKINENKLDSFNITLLQCLQNQNKEITKLKQNLNNLQQHNINLENKLLQIEDWKNQQIINNFKIEYPNYEFITILNITTPFLVEKGQRFYSDTFIAFGLKWKIVIFPKGKINSREGECGVYLHLISPQYKNKKEISSIELDFLFTNANLLGGERFNYDFTKVKGFGSYNLKQINFPPILENEKQIFTIVVGMEKLYIEFK